MALVLDRERRAAVDAARGSGDACCAGVRSASPVCADAPSRSPMSGRAAVGAYGPRIRVGIRAGLDSSGDAARPGRARKGGAAIPSGPALRLEVWRPMAGTCTASPATAWRERERRRPQRLGPFRRAAERTAGHPGRREPALPAPGFRRRLQRIVLFVAHPVGVGQELAYAASSRPRSAYAVEPLGSRGCGLDRCSSRQQPWWRERDVQSRPRRARTTACDRRAAADVRHRAAPTD